MITEGRSHALGVWTLRASSDGAGSVTADSAAAADGDEASDVERVARACPELKKLNLARVGAGIDDAGACALARGGARASLTDLDLSWTEVGDDGCHALFRSCSALKLLAVQGCKALTPRCVRGLFEEADEREVAAPALQWIDFSWVNTMSVTLAEAVLRARLATP